MAVWLQTILNLKALVRIRLILLPKDVGSTDPAVVPP